MSLPAGIKILDAGAGELRWKDTCSHLQYTSQDFCQYDGVGNSDGLNTGKWDTSAVDIVSDITAIPVEAASFDAVLCTEVLEHIPNPELAICEFARVLSKDGILILTAPFCSLTHMAPYHFVSGFNRYWYESVLDKYGFTIEEIECNGNYILYLIQELKRVSYVIERYCGKKDLFIKVLSKLFIRCLRRYMENDSGELLCFGYHVRAKKR